MKQKLSSPGFADLFLGQRKVKQTFFSQINTVIDWAPIRAIIEVAYTRGYKSTGRPSYDSLVSFKIELLRTWYGRVAEKLKIRLTTACLLAVLQVLAWKILFLIVLLCAGIARYVGLSKTHAQHIMESIAYNLYRTPRIIVSNCIR